MVIFPGNIFIAMIATALTELLGSLLYCPRYTAIYGKFEMINSSGFDDVDRRTKCPISLPSLHQECKFDFYTIPVNTGRKINVHKMFRRRPGRLLNVLCTFSLRPVSTEILVDLENFLYNKIFSNKPQIKSRKCNSFSA